MVAQRKSMIVGTGWLGRSLAEHMDRAGWTVSGTTRSARRLGGLRETGLDVSPFSLGDRLSAELAQRARNAVVIIAVPPSGSGLAPEDFYAGLTRLSRDVCEAGARAIVFVSSTSVYPRDAGEVREGDAVDAPSSRSGISLLAAERSVVEGGRDCAVAVVRFSGLFGPGREPAGFFATRPLRYPDDPVNMIHQRDCIGVLELAASLEESVVMNASCPEHPTKRFFYSAAFEEVGAAFPRVVGPARSRRPKIVNSDRLRGDLGYRFVYEDPIEALGVSARGD
jgi:nucleoside-diphosphate-sugar epimerase